MDCEYRVMFRRLLLIIGVWYFGLDDCKWLWCSILVHELTTNRIMTQLHTSRMSISISSILCHILTCGWFNSEEVRRAAFAAPVAIFVAVIGTGILGWLLNIVLILCSGSLWACDISFFYSYFVLNYGRQRIPPSCFRSIWFWFPSGSCDILLFFFFFSCFLAPTSSCPSWSSNIYLQSLSSSASQITMWLYKDWALKILYDVGEIRSPVLILMLLLFMVKRPRRGIGITEHVYRTRGSFSGENNIEKSSADHTMSDYG